MTCWIMGVGASHNGGACLLRDGELEVAVQQERLTREKRSRLRPAFDTVAMRYCLDHASIAMRDVALLALSADEPLARPDFDITRNALVQDGGGPGAVVHVSHHLAHAAAAAWQSGFEDAAVLVIDGMGSPIEDCSPEEQELAGRSGWETMSMYRLEGGRLTAVRKDVAANRGWMTLSDSGMPRFAGFGGMYSAVSHQIFGQYLEAGKVMGLAPYGRAEFPATDFFTLNGGGPHFRAAVPERFPSDERWPHARDRYCALAASVQAALEEAVIWAARECRRLTRQPRLVYGGGVALNCIANERILRELAFEDVFIIPSAEDSSLAIGAAVVAARERGHALAVKRLERDAPGRPYGARAVRGALQRFPLGAAAGAAEPAGVAERLARGEIVGFYEGGAELGPRALGQRSILADPRDAAVRDELNRRKGRESFRPLAPVVLAEHATDWFELGSRPDSPFMLRACPVPQERRASVPAVVHVDGTARLQTVDGTQSRLRAVLEAFEALTGVPVLVNTSLNAAGEPIVETPEDALWCAWRLGLDAIAFPDVLVTLDGCDRDGLEVRALPHRIRRRALSQPPSAGEVEADTPWGPALYWLQPEELELLEGVAAGPRSLNELESAGAARAVESLRRRRLLAISR